MKLSKIILAAALPLVLSAGCAMEVGTSSEGLTTERDNDFGINECGESLQNTLAEADWPIETIVAGDMEFTKEDLIEHFETNPGLRSDLMAEMAAVQLDMAVGLVLPDDVIDGLIAADEFLMAPKDDDGSTPPLVNLDDFASLRDFNRAGLAFCFTGDGVTADILPGTEDVREGLSYEAESTVDTRLNLATKR